MTATLSRLRSWLRPPSRAEAEAALPAGQCLLQTTYGMNRRPLGTDLVPDYAGFNGWC